MVAIAVSPQWNLTTYQYTRSYLNTTLTRDGIHPFSYLSSWNWYCEAGESTTACQFQLGPRIRYQKVASLSSKISQPHTNLSKNFNYQWQSDSRTVVNLQEDSTFRVTWCLVFSTTLFEYLDIPDIKVLETSMTFQNALKILWKTFLSSIDTFHLWTIPQVLVFSVYSLLFYTAL